MFADPTCKIAQIGKEAGGEAEFGSESGNGIKPRFWIGADTPEDGSEIDSDDARFI